MENYIKSLEEASQRGDVDGIRRIVNEVKLYLLMNGETDPQRYDFFQKCICVAVSQMQDEISNYIQLYNTFCKDDTNMDRKLLVMSLNLLYLLITNDLSAFHAELELLSEEELKHPSVQFSVAIEGYMTTGRYSKIRECMNNLPNPIFSYLISFLLESIRVDIESCIEVAYTSMSLRDLAAAISWNQSPDELTAYIQMQHPTWKINNEGVITFPRQSAEIQEITKHTLGDLIKQVNDMQTI